MTPEAEQAMTWFSIMGVAVLLLTGLKAVDNWLRRREK